MKRSLMAAGVLAALAVSAAAAPVADVYDRSGSWTIEAWNDAGTTRMCSARIANPSARPDFGSFLRLENDGKGWAVASDYLISGNSVDADMLIDGSSFPVRFTLDDDVVRAPIDQGMVDAIAAGRRLNLNLDPSGQNFSLRGAEAALAKAEECARMSGLQNAGRAGVNEYNGYNIAGTPQARESPYGAVRAWTVLSASIDGNFAYCAGEFDDNGSAWRLGWDGMQWQIGLPMKAKPDWQGDLDVDGDRRPISGSARNGWTFLWLGMPELDKIRAGDVMTVDVGRASVEHALMGTAAVVTKIEECVQRKGRDGGGMAAAPAPRPFPPADAAEGDDKPANESDAANASGCPDDGPRLPFTGLCAGRAVNYLTGKTNYSEANFPIPDCEWVVNEVQVVEDALLYRALRCKGVTTQLEFAGGAQWAQLMVARSALNAAYGRKPEVEDPQPLVWFNTIDPEHVERDLDRRSRQGAEAELSGRKCAIHKADPSLTPDGYVFDVTPEDPIYAQQRREPTPPACGRFSAGDGVVRFWRVLGDTAFLFDLSADLYQDIDPDSVTLLRKDGNGDWAAVQ